MIFTVIRQDKGTPKNNVPEGFKKKSKSERAKLNYGNEWEGV